MKKHYIYANNPKLKKRCVYVVKGGWAYCLIGDHKFKYENNENKGVKDNV